MRWVVPVGLVISVSEKDKIFCSKIRVNNLKRADLTPSRIEGVKNLIAKSDVDKHRNYLMRVGFTEDVDNKNTFRKKL